jgi:pimeloyl-ACP methyl ester carboxylesterase
MLAIHEHGARHLHFVVLVHGSMDRSAGMVKIAKRLVDRVHVMTYDRRGYGRSVQHPGPFTIEAHVDDLVGLIDGRPFVAVGHSFGGNIALAAAERLGALARGVVIYETPMSWLPWWPGGTAAQTVEQSNHDPTNAAESFMRRMVGDDRWERLPATTRSARRSEGRALVGEIISLGSGPPWDPGAITCPVVLGVGSLARPHHARGMPEAATWFQDARLVRLEGCGHMAPTQTPDRFVNELIAPLLDRIGW